MYLLFLVFILVWHICRYEEILAKQEDDGKPKKVEKDGNNEEENYDDFDWDAFEKEELEE